MRVLLGLCNAQLGQALVRDILAEGVLQALRLEGNLNARDGRIILRHADVVDVAALTLEAVELVVNERTGDLTRAVGTEVGEDDRVVILDGRALGHDDRNDELVGDACVIGRLHRLVCGSSMLADALGDRLICLFYAVPALVAVHRVVTAGDGGNAAKLQRINLVLQAVDILDTGLRGRVTAVHEAVEAYLAQTVAARQLEQREHVIDMRVYAAVGQQAEDMQRGIKPFALVDCAHERLVREEIAVLNGLGDAGQLLIDDTARTDIGVTNLGVAHLAVRQTDIQTGSADINQRILLKDAVKVRGVGRLNGIALLLLTMAETVHDDQRGRLLGLVRLLGRRLAGRGLLCSGRLLGCGLCLSFGLRRRSRSRSLYLFGCRLARHILLFHILYLLLYRSGRKGTTQFPMSPPARTARGVNPHRNLILLIGCFDDGCEVSALQGGAADQAAVNIRLSQQLGCVLGVHRTTVLDGDAASCTCAILLAQAVTDCAADLARLLSGRGLAGADRPDRLVSDNNLLDVLHSNALQRDLDLLADNLHGHILLALGQALANAQDRTQAVLQCNQNLLVASLVGFVEVLTALRVADDHILHAQFLEHIGRDLARERTGLLLQVFSSGECFSEVSLWVTPAAGRVTRFFIPARLAHLRLLRSHVCRHRC